MPAPAWDPLFPGAALRVPGANREASGSPSQRRQLQRTAGLPGLASRARPRLPNSFPVVCASRLTRCRPSAGPALWEIFPSERQGPRHPWDLRWEAFPGLGLGAGSLLPSKRDGFSRESHSQGCPALPRKERLATRIAVQACNCSRYVKVSKERMALLSERSGCWTGEDAEAFLGEPGPTTTLEPQSCSLGLHQPARSPPWRGPEVAGPGDEPALLPTGVRLKVEAVPPGVLCQKDPACFYCCSQCGQVFWEGSHLGRLVSQFREVLELPEES